jgi:hypothetical protein
MRNSSKTIIFFGLVVAVALVAGLPSGSGSGASPTTPPTTGRTQEPSGKTPMANVTSGSKPGSSSTGTKMNPPTPPKGNSTSMG